MVYSGSDEEDEEFFGMQSVTECLSKIKPWINWIELFCFSTQQKKQQHINNTNVVGNVRYTQLIRLSTAYF